MASAPAYEDIDMGFDALFTEMSNADGMAVETGLFDPPQAFKGVIAEYGTETIEARPWLSIAADTSVGKIERVGAAELRSFGPRMSFKQALNIMGAVMAEHTRAVIRTGKVGGPPLKRATVERKGNSKKLLDSLAMYGAITYEVTMEGAP